MSGRPAPLPSRTQPQPQPQQPQQQPRVFLGGDALLHQRLQQQQQQQPQAPQTGQQLQLVHAQLQGHKTGDPSFDARATQHPQGAEANERLRRDLASMLQLRGQRSHEDLMRRSLFPGTAPTAAQNAFRPPTHGGSSSLDLDDYAQRFAQGGVSEAGAGTFSGALTFQSAGASTFTSELDSIASEMADPNADPATVALAGARGAIFGVFHGGVVAGADGRVAQMVLAAPGRERAPRNFPGAPPPFMQQMLAAGDWSQAGIESEEERLKTQADVEEFSEQVSQSLMERNRLDPSLVRRIQQQEAFDRKRREAAETNEGESMSANLEALISEELSGRMELRRAKEEERQVKFLPAVVKVAESKPVTALLMAGSMGSSKQTVRTEARVKNHFDEEVEAQEREDRPAEVDHSASAPHDALRLGAKGSTVLRMSSPFVRQPNGLVDLSSLPPTITQPKAAKGVSFTLPTTGGAGGGMSDQSDRDMASQRSMQSAVATSKAAPSSAVRAAPTFVPHTPSMASSDQLATSSHMASASAAPAPKGFQFALPAAPATATTRPEPAIGYTPTQASNVSVQRRMPAKMVQETLMRVAAERGEQISVFTSAPQLGGDSTKASSVVVRASAPFSSSATPQTLHEEGALAKGAAVPAPPTSVHTKGVRFSLPASMAVAGAPSESKDRLEASRVAPSRASSHFVTQAKAAFGGVALREGASDTMEAVPPEQAPHASKHSVMRATAPFAGLQLGEAQKDRLQAADLSRPASKHEAFALPSVPSTVNDRSGRAPELQERDFTSAASSDAKSVHSVMRATISTLGNAPGGAAKDVMQDDRIASSQNPPATLRNKAWMSEARAPFVSSQGVSAASDRLQEPELATRASKSWQTTAKAPTSQAQPSAATDSLDGSLARVGSSQKGRSQMTARSDGGFRAGNGEVQEREVSSVGVVGGESFAPSMARKLRDSLPQQVQGPSMGGDSGSASSRADAWNWDVSEPVERRSGNPHPLASTLGRITVLSSAPSANGSSVDVGAPLESPLQPVQGPSIASLTPAQRRAFVQAAWSDMFGQVNDRKLTW